MAARPLDLLVVGGGITGAGVARDAALRGMRVALVEKGDFGGGTSSRSSKIIHGGVRYLEYLQFGMVRESARERRILRRIAPHLVHPLPFLYPVFAGESLLRIRAGLRLFDLFARAPREEWSRRLSPDATREYLPGLRDPLKGAVLYPEYITDDARFTLANVRSAAEAGALVANHARVVSLRIESGSVVGAEVEAARDGDANGSGIRLELQAEVTVNAAGPWVPELLRESGLEAPRRIVPSKGIHLLFDRNRIPLRAATFLRASNGRRGLALPRGRWLYVGTSDDAYDGPLDAPRAHPGEIDELVAMMQDCFPDLDLGTGDVRGSWAGLRPLLHEEGKSTRDMSRHDEVWIAPPGLVTVAGGKLTTYRPMASRILEQVARARGRPLPRTERTADAPLPGTPVEPMEPWRHRMESALETAGVAPETRERLAFLYGTEIEELLALGREDPAWLEPLGPGVPALRGEVFRAADREMALTLADVLDRRLALLLFSPDAGRAGAEEAARILAARLGWPEARRRAEVAAYETLAREHGPRGVPVATRD